MSNTVAAAAMAAVAAAAAVAVAATATAATLKLNCLVEGDDAGTHTFPVTVSSTDTIAELKKNIKKEKAPEFDDFAADKLRLYKADVFGSDLAGRDLGDELLAIDEIQDVFPEIYRKHIHVVVRLPSHAPVSNIQCMCFIYIYIIDCLIETYFFFYFFSILFNSATKAKAHVMGGRYIKNYIRVIQERHCGCCNVRY